MKLLGSTDDGGGRGPPSRSQDDAAVGYVFQRHGHEPEFSQFAQKQSRWASGDDAIVDDKWKYNGPMNSIGVGGILNAPSKQQQQPMPQMMNHHMQQQPHLMPQHLGHQQQQQSHQLMPHHQLHPHHQNHQMGTNSNQMSNNSPLSSHSHLAPSHLASGQQQQQQQQQISNHSLAPGLPLQLAQIQGAGIYDHHSVHQNVNGMSQGPPGGPPKINEQLVYLGGQPPHLSVIQPQNQYMANARNSVGIASSAAKKLWEKGNSGPLAPLQLHGGPDNQVWRDSTWSTQGEILGPRRSFPQDNSVDSAGILSPRDSTVGLGVKMVEYVLGGSPTNKESPLAGLEPRLRSLKFEEKNDEKEKNSPFDTNGLKKEEPTTNGVVNGIDEDKGFNRTPGSRQPSPAEEALTRPQTLLDPSAVGSAYHILNGDPSQQMNSSFHQMQAMNQMQGGPVMNGMHHQVQPQDPFYQNQMMNQAQQHQHGQNQLDSSGNMQNFDIQQLFRSQNPGLATANANAPGQPNGTPLPQHLPQFFGQQNAYAAAAAAQQPAPPYVINSGQDAAPYMGLITTGMPQYYGVTTAPWGVYPANLLPPQQGSQPRRPLTPSQQGAENAPYQVITYYDQNGSLMVGPRTGTPLRLVSPAPVLVPPGAPRAPQGCGPQPYPPQPPQAQYSAQNGSSVGGGGGLFAPQAFSSGLGTLGSPAQPSGLALNTGRRDSFDRNTSAFSPSSLDYSSSATMAAAANGTRSSAAAIGKWPIGSYGGLGTVAAASASPHGAPITPPPGGLGTLVSNRAPGAESKYRNQLAPVGLPSTSTSAHAAAAAAVASNAMFGSNSSLFSKLTNSVRPSSTITTNAVAAAQIGLDRQSVTTSGRSRLLEEFRNQRYPNLQLRELTNHIVEFSQDQHGSRFIQQKLERATAAEKQLVFTEILGAAYNLMTDVFGNYVIQKFFEHGTPEQKQTLAQQVKGHVLPLALQMYGCRVIQKALESIPPEQQQEVVRELDGHVLKCVKDQNGNHVVQKCIECVEPNALQFVINAFEGQVLTLSTHPYGCRVIQRILEHCTPDQTAPILKELHTHTNDLIEDQYGNYVIQHVLEHGKPDDKSVLIASVRGKVLNLSQHKFASNVVEKCVTHATRAERALLIEEVCSFNDSALHIMMKDQYANYVVQKMIDVSEPTQRKILMHKIRPHMNSLRKYTYGKHIIAKIEKFFMKNSSSVTVVNGTGKAASGDQASTNNGLGPIGPPPTNGGL